MRFTKKCINNKCTKNMWMRFTKKCINQRNGCVLHRGRARTSQLMTANRDNDKERQNNYGTIRFAWTFWKTIFQEGFGAIIERIVSRRDSRIFKATVIVSRNFNSRGYFRAEFLQIPLMFRICVIMYRTITQGCYKHTNNIRTLSAENRCQEEESVD